MTRFTHVRDMKGWWIILSSIFTVVASSAIFCSQCDSDTDPHCMDDPPSPQNCTSCEKFDSKTAECVVFMPLSYCQIERRYINSTLIRLRRDCIPAMMRTTCQIVVEHGEDIRACFETCKTDGCNMNSAESLHPNLPSILSTLLLIIYRVYAMR